MVNLLKYLKFIVIMGCGSPVAILPPNVDLAKDICERGQQCKLVDSQEYEACHWCVACFFAINGGEKKWYNTVQDKLSGSCSEVESMGNYAEIFKCMDSYQPHGVCVSGGKK